MCFGGIVGIIFAKHNQIFTSNCYFDIRNQGHAIFLIFFSVEKN